MSNERPCPVEEWAPMFTRNFNDSQILDPNFMIVGGGVPMCKLCDAKLTEPQTAHVARHTAELKAWRSKRRKESDKSAKEKQQARSEEKALERATGVSKVSEERYLANRVTSARYKLNHPEKHGHEDGWPQQEKARLHDTLEEAIKALTEYREKPKEGKE